MPYGEPNPMTMLPPKAPSAMIKTLRYGFLLSGFAYGLFRLDYLKKAEKQYQDENKAKFEFIKARAYKHKEDRTVLDAVNLHREVNGLPLIKKDFKL
ncbi:hypothetical protein ACF0H5_008632 [Mactra antiquata]